MSSIFCSSRGDRQPGLLSYYVWGNFHQLQTADFSGLQFSKVMKTTHDLHTTCFTFYLHSIKNYRPENQQFGVDESYPWLMKVTPIDGMSIKILIVEPIELNRTDWSNRSNSIKLIDRTIELIDRTIESNRTFTCFFRLIGFD